MEILVFLIKLVISSSFLWYPSSKLSIKWSRISGSFCRYRKALYFWSLGISLYLELFCFLSFITIVLRNLCSGTHRRNRISLLTTSFPCMLPMYLNSGSPGSWTPGLSEISNTQRILFWTDSPSGWSLVIDGYFVAKVWRIFVIAL